MADITLYHGYPGVSSWSLRAWLALRKSGLDFEQKLIDYRSQAGSAELKRTSPNGLVPLLVHRAGDGETLVWESLAVCEYIAELAPAVGLWPDDRGLRALARSVSAEMHAGFGAMRRGLDMAVLERRTADIDTPVQADIDRIAAIWSSCRSKPGAGEGPWLFGRFTVADAMYAPVATRFRTYGIPLDGAAAAYCDAVLDDPDMKVWEDMARAIPTPPRA